LNAENSEELTEIHTRRSLPPHRKVRAQKTQPAGWELGRQTPGMKGWPWMTVPGGRHVHRMVGEEPKMRFAKVVGGWTYQNEGHVGLDLRRCMGVRFAKVAGGWTYKNEGGRALIVKVVGGRISRNEGRRWPNLQK